MQCTLFLVNGFFMLRDSKCLPFTAMSAFTVYQAHMGTFTCTCSVSAGERVNLPPSSLGLAVHASTATGFVVGK